jgi:hypothetical protein
MQEESISSLLLFDIVSTTLSLERYCRKKGDEVKVHCRTWGVFRYILPIVGFSIASKNSINPQIFFKPNFFNYSGWKMHRSLKIMRVKVGSKDAVLDSFGEKFASNRINHLSKGRIRPGAGPYKKVFIL